MRLIRIWSAKQPKTYKKVLLVVCGNTQWKFSGNWKFNRNGTHFNIIMPFLRLTRCNGNFTVGLGNHYIIIGW